MKIVYITPSQAEVLNEIKYFFKMYGKMPTYTHLECYTGYNRCNLKKKIKQLCKAGALKSLPNNKYGFCKIYHKVKVIYSPKMKMKNESKKEQQERINSYHLTKFEAAQINSTLIWKNGR